MGMNPQPPCGGELPPTLMADAVARLTAGLTNPEIGRPDTQYWRATKAQGRASIGEFSSSPPVGWSPCKMLCSSLAASWSSTGLGSGPLTPVEHTSGGGVASCWLLGAGTRADGGGESIRLTPQSPYAPLKQIVEAVISQCHYL